MDASTNGGQQLPVTVKRALSSEQPESYVTHNMDVHDQNSYDYHVSTQNWIDDR